MRKVALHFDQKLGRWCVLVEHPSIPQRWNTVESFEKLDEARGFAECLRRVPPEYRMAAS